MNQISKVALDREERKKIEDRISVIRSQLRTATGDERAELRDELEALQDTLSQP